MDVCIGRILELARLPPAVCPGQFFGFGHHARAFLRARRQHDAGTEKAHQLAPLDAEILGHGYHQRVALARTHHRQADAGVAAGSFDDGLPRFEIAATFGVFDDPQRQSVLDRTHRVEGFHFNKEIHAGRTQLVDANHRCVTDGSQYIVESFSHRPITVPV